MGTHRILESAFCMYLSNLYAGHKVGFVSHLDTMERSQDLAHIGRQRDEDFRTLSGHGHETDRVLAVDLGL